jgi:hypothetical protein
MMKSFKEPADIYSKEIITPDEQEKLQLYMDSVMSKLEGVSVTGSAATYDFFGILAEVDPDEQKALVLDTYKLIFRFSIQKLIKYLGDFHFLLLLLQYLKSTQMERAHTRLVMEKN